MSQPRPARPSGNLSQSRPSTSTSTFPMPSPIDEFGSISLESLLSSDEGDMPELEQIAPFSTGPVFRQTPSAYSETHLVALITRHECALCQTPSLVGTGFALRRLHSSRNACVEYQSIMAFAVPRYDHLPRMTYLRVESMPFCVHCIGDFNTQRSLAEGENS